MELANEMVVGCADVTDGDRCEAAVKIFACMKNIAVAKGLTADDMWMDHQQTTELKLFWIILLILCTFESHLILYIRCHQIYLN